MRLRGAAGHKTMKSIKAKWLLTLLSGTGAGLYPVVSAALGLGDIQIDSRLNQALRARIEIVGVSDEEWRLIRASIASQLLSSGDAAHPELLGSVTLSPIEDADHRHFIQVKSSSVFTEPLFDLPIEVSDPTAHVVRSYAVLLDPEETVSPPQQVAASNMSHDVPVAAVTAPQPAKAGSAAVAPKAAHTKRHSGRRHSARAAKHARSRKHAPGAVPAPSATATSSVASASGVASGPNATSSSSATPTSAQGSAKDQLERQLAMLQQMLAQMQTTIAAQDAEIAKLTRAVASGTPAGEASAARPVEQAVATAPAAVHDVVPPSTTAQSPARGPAVAQSQPVTQAVPADSDVDAGDVKEPTSFWRRPGFFYWVVSGLGLTAALAAVSLWLARRRKAQEDRGVSVEERYSPLRKDEPKKTYQMAQPSSYQVEEHSEGGNAASSAKAAAARDAADSDADSDADGVESWRTQTALLEQDILSATGSLPFVKDEKNHVETTQTQERPSVVVDDEKTLELHQTLDSLEIQQTLESLEMQQTLEVRQPSDAQHTLAIQRTLDSLTMGRGPERAETNGDVVKALEHTLDIEPDRVDLQLKLLEIYHHEALGNRDNFHSLLSRLNVEQEGLSPAQRSHLEMLRRTLDDSKADADSNFATEAAI